MSTLGKVMTMSAMVAGGMAVGAGLGILLAPNSGRVTRGQIQVQAHKVQDQMTHMGGHVMQKVDTALEEVTQMGGRVMQKVDTTLEEVTHMGGRVMQKVDIALEKGKQVLTNHKEV